MTSPSPTAPAGPTIDLAGQHREPGWPALGLTIRPARKPDIDALDALHAELRRACRFMGVRGSGEFGTAGRWADGTRTIRFAVTGPALGLAAPARLRGALARIAWTHCGDTSEIAFDGLLAEAPARALPAALFEFFVTVTSPDGDEWVERARGATPHGALETARRKQRPEGATVGAIDPEPARVLVDGDEYDIDSLAAARLAAALIAERHAALAMSEAA